MRKAVFIDRDGTLMLDTGYCHEPEKVRLIEGAAEGLRLLHDAGFFLVIVTNQSGLARGYFSEKELVAVNLRLRDELRAHGADFGAVFYCPHHPDDGCDCRKPRPGLILRAALEYSLELESSFTVGDQESDILAGKSAGTRTVMISDVGVSQSSADFIAKDLVEAAGIILRSDAAVDASVRTTPSLKSERSH
jgi:D-glycero-D-manno-heptose 1,7-bisphosphate phosphatase